MSKMSNQYLPEDHEHDITGRISDLYGIHVNAMTREGLHSKSHIAWELARRDLAVEELREALREIVEADQMGFAEESGYGICAFCEERFGHLETCPIRKAEKILSKS